jgi:hypothetical protein
MILTGDPKANFSLSAEVYWLAKPLEIANERSLSTASQE